MYKNNHTTSTKCQYQQANSNPKWWLLEKLPFSKRKKQTIKKKVPTKTWNPWNPVIIKKTDPNTESLIEKNLILYSKIWKIENKIAKKTVIINPINLSK